MIVGVIGLPGAGKTTLLTKAVYQWLHGRSFLGIKSQKVIFSNFDCPGCYKLDFDHLGLYNFHDCNMVIDEIMLLADNRNFKNFPEHLKEFFCLHRRSKVGVLWASQQANCDKKIRELTEYYYILDNTIIPHVSVVVPVHHKIDNLEDKYVKGAPIEWKLLARFRYYYLFDSFESKLHSLPPPKLEAWTSGVPGFLPRRPAPRLLRWLRGLIKRKKKSEIQDPCPPGGQG